MIQISIYIPELCLSNLVLRRESTTGRLQCEWQDCTDSEFFDRDIPLWQHIKKEHIHSRIFECSNPGCGKMFDRLSKLNEHSRAHEDSTAHKDKQNTVHLINCEWQDCKNRNFSCFSTLWRHIKEKHSLPGVFKCNNPGCEREFGRQDKLDEHLQVHVDNKERKGKKCYSRHA